MSITGTSCHRGTSTILGTLIFIGIIFTSFIPMMLVMKQADTLYDLRKHEIGILDQERIDEDVYVYVFPGTEGSTTLTLKVQNRGNLVVNVVQVWINDDPHPINDFNLPPMSSDEIDLIDFTPEDETSYLIKINTDRGNVFSSDSGSLKYISNGQWEGGAFALNFLISYPESGWYIIEIWQEVPEGWNLLTEPTIEIHKSSSSPAFAFFQVNSADKYHVHITKNSNIIHDEDITIHAYGSPVEWVFA